MTKEESAKLLDKAAQICVSKHAGQRDKMGCAYFLHPMRVAMRCRTDEEKMVAPGNSYLPKRTKLLHPTYNLNYQKILSFPHRVLGYTHGDWYIPLPMP